MIDKLKKIIRAEINKEKKENLYRKIITIDTTKITYVSIGKLSY